MDPQQVTIFAPDGTQGSVPFDKVMDAVKAGGQLGIPVYAPDGTPGYVPQNRVHDAVVAGGTLEPKDDRNSVQKTFDANTQINPQDSLVQRGLKAATAAVGAPIIHPVKTLRGLPSAMTLPSAEDIAQQTNDPNKPTLAQGVAEGVGGFAGSLLLGKAAEPIVAPVIEGVAKVLPRIPGALAQGKAAVGKVTYPKNLSLTPEEVTAQNVVKALQPDPAAVPNVKSASPEIPDALAYAKREGIPQNGKLDTAKALQGRADEIQAHYDDKILKPNQTAVQTVPANYDGATVGENRATLGQINDRVDVINKELKSNFRKKLSSQTTEANASDADLLGEKANLTTILHTKLGELTGIAPEEIAAIRQRAGKLRSLAQEVTDSANKDTLAAGRREVSAGTFSLRNPMEAIQDKIGGGQEVIGNRSWKQTLADIAPTEKPLPQPNGPGPNVPTTPEAAQAEFLKAQELEQAAQDSSSQRGALARAVRLDKRAATGPNLWSSQGFAKVVNHLEIDPSSGIGRADLVKFGLTPEGKSLLIRASTLSPGSPAMRNMVTKIADQLRNK